MIQVAHKACQPAELAVARLALGVLKDGAPRRGKIVLVP